MMLKWQGCFLCFLFSAMTGSELVNGQDIKQGCIGESIKIKENISVGITAMYVSIYKNEENNMGYWHINDGFPLIKNGYSQRVILDRKGSIWITDLVESDSDKYFIRTETGNVSKVETVRLNVIAPPTKNCKPKITRYGDYLTADLNHVKNKECGDPHVQIYWLDQTENSITRELNGFGIYHACVKGDSLTCVKMSNVTEFCSSFNYSTSSSATSSGLYIGVVIGLSLVVFVLMIVLMCVWRYCQCRRIPNLSSCCSWYTPAKTIFPEENHSLIAKDGIGFANQRNAHGKRSSFSIEVTNADEEELHESVRETLVQDLSSPEGAEG